MRKKRNWLPLLAVLVMAVLAMTTGAFAAGEEAAEYVSPFHATAWSLLPPVIAIGLALITKEVYSSLFIGILAGGLLYFLVDYGIFYLALGTRQVVGADPFAFLLWLSVSYLSLIHI